MHKQKNNDELDRLHVELKGTEYAFIPKVIAKSSYMEFYTMKIVDQSLRIYRYGVEIVSICWSWNEPKIWVSSGVLNFRLIATKEALIAAFFALDSASDLYNKKLEKYEL